MPNARGSDKASASDSLEEALVLRPMMSADVSAERIGEVQSETNTGKQPCHFLALPAELRIMIYEYALAGLIAEIPVYLQDHQRGYTAALTRTCKQIHQEAGHMLFDLNHIAICLEHPWNLYRMTEEQRIQRWREEERREEETRQLVEKARQREEEKRRREQEERRRQFASLRSQAEAAPSESLRHLVMMQMRAGAIEVAPPQPERPSYRAPSPAEYIPACEDFNIAGKTAKRNNTITTLRAALKDFVTRRMPHMDQKFHVNVYLDEEYTKDFSSIQTELRAIQKRAATMTLFVSFGHACVPTPVTLASPEKAIKCIKAVKEKLPEEATVAGRELGYLQTRLIRAFWPVWFIKNLA